MKKIFNSIKNPFVLLHISFLWRFLQSSVLTDGYTVGSLRHTRSLSFNKFGSLGNEAVLPFTHLSATEDSATPEWEEASESAAGVSPDAPASSHSTIRVQNEFVALLQGQKVPVQIGSLSLARKAWKKRRRSYSPILVPCSIVSIPHKAAVRSNIIYLLHKYGDDINDVEHMEARSLNSPAFIGGGKGGGAGVALPCDKLKKLYKRKLGGNLLQHAKAITGQSSISALLNEVIDTHTKIKYGIEILGNELDDEEEETLDEEEKVLCLVSSLPKRRSRDWVGNVALAQVAVTLNTNEKEGNIGIKQSPVKHTGMVRLERRILASKQGSGDLPSKSRRSLEPLGAALRIAQQKTHSDNSRDNKEIEIDAAPPSSSLDFMLEGETRFAHVLQFNAVGDGDGSPLLTLCLDPPKGALLEKESRSKIIQREQQARDEKVRLLKQGILSSTPQYSLQDISVGDGPFTAHVVRVSHRSRSVFVDFGVGREKGKSAGGGTTQVLGMLRFEDLETNLDKLRDGSISAKISDEQEGVDRAVPGNVQVGDSLQVFVQSVSLQSGRFMVTLDPNIQNMSPKEVKQKRVASKKLQKLVDLIGGEAGLRKLLEMKGTEGEGTVKATSQSGNWLYVQPDFCLNEGNTKAKRPLPVGVAVKASDELDTLHPGDKVRICLDGVDDNRGQLAMKIMERLAP